MSIANILKNQCAISDPTDPYAAPNGYNYNGDQSGSYHDASASEHHYQQHAPPQEDESPSISGFVKYISEGVTSGIRRVRCNFRTTLLQGHLLIVRPPH